MPKKNTRNARGSGMIRQRPSGLWEARYTIGRDPGTGKQIQKSVYGKTQNEVRQKLQKTCTEIDEGVYIEPTKMTLSAWLDLWIGEYQGGVKPATAQLYEQQVRVYIKPALGAVKLEQLDTHTIQGFYNKLGKPRGEKPALAAKSIKNIHGIFHKALQQAVAIGYLRFNPSDACTLPRVERKEIHPLEDVQITAFLNAIKGHRFETLYTVDLFTGMREGEILGLMWECVDFKNGTIRIDKQLRKEMQKGGDYYFSSPKNGRTRTLAPAPWVMKLLKSYKAVQAQWQLKAGQAWAGTGLVFTNELGALLPYRTVYDSFKRVVASIGTPTTRFHDLRHTYAVSAIRSGDDIKTIQANLGHATAAFTLDVYGHMTEQMKRESGARMEGYIRDVLNL